MCVSVCWYTCFVGRFGEIWIIANKKSLRCRRWREINVIRRYERGPFSSFHWSRAGRSGTFTLWLPLPSKPWLRLSIEIEMGAAPHLTHWQNSLTTITSTTENVWLALPNNQWRGTNAKQRLNELCIMKETQTKRIMLALMEVAIMKKKKIFSAVLFRLKKGPKATNLGKTKLRIRSELGRTQSQKTFL